MAGIVFNFVYPLSLLANILGAIICVQYIVVDDLIVVIYIPNLNPEQINIGVGGKVFINSRDQPKSKPLTSSWQNPDPSPPEHFFSW